MFPAFMLDKYQFISVYFNIKNVPEFNVMLNGMNIFTKNKA